MNDNQTSGDIPFETQREGGRMTNFAQHLSNLFCHAKQGILKNIHKPFCGPMKE